MLTIDLERFHAAPLQREPFDYLIVPGFVQPAARVQLEADFPRITRPGSFPLRSVRGGAMFDQLMQELTGPEVCRAFTAKFGLDLASLPTVLTVRGRCSQQDGSIHTDLPGKVITVLIYLNDSWENEGGRLRLLRSNRNIDDVIAEVPPVEGTLLAFRRCDHSWHGHKPHRGERRVVQMNWVTRQHRWALRRAAMRTALTGFLRDAFRFARPREPAAHQRVQPWIPRPMPRLAAPEAAQ
jgi:hypothetical protein